MLVSITRTLSVYIGYGIKRPMLIYLSTITEVTCDRPLMNATSR
jgi:hypothetical protein